MAYTARELIIEAYYLSGVVSELLQTVTGMQLFNGLKSLNMILDGKKSDPKLIPYYEEYIFDTVGGQEKYFIPNLVEAETLTFYVGNIRFASLEISREKYFGTFRVDPVLSLPFTFHLERCLGGTNCFFYFQPNAAYTVHVWGKFAIVSVVPEQDLSLSADLFFWDYIKHELAYYICNSASVPLPEGTAERLAYLKRQNTFVSPKDMSSIKSNRLAGASTFPTLADAYIGKGWRPANNSEFIL